MTNYGVQFVGHIPDPGVVSNCDPALFANSFEPFLVGSVIGEMVTVPLDFHIGGGKNGRKFFAEITIGEKCEIQAARS